MVWFGLRQHSSEASVKVSSRSDFFGRLEKIKSWFGLTQYPSEDSVKVSSRSDLFWLFKRRLFVISLLTYLCVWGQITP